MTVSGSWYNQCFLLLVSFFEPFLTNGFSHHYLLDESSFILGASGVILNFHFFLGKSFKQTE